MTRKRHVFLKALTVLSALLCVGVVLLWPRSLSTSDVLLVPTGRQSAILLTSEGGFSGMGWCEILFATNWPGPRLGLWSGAGWKNVGPFIQWRAQDYSWGRHRVVLMAGSFMTPRDSPTGPISYQDSYRRAEQLGFPGVLAPPPRSAVVSACRLQVPHIYLAFLFELLPAIWLIRTIRRQRRKSMPGCPVCGYDLRATPHRCPECGTKTANEPTVTSK